MYFDTSRTDPELLEALKRAAESVKNMSPEDYAEMIRAQRESYVRSGAGGEGTGAPCVERDVDDRTFAERANEGGRRMSEFTFIAEDEEKASNVLGPEYFASKRLAEDMLGKFKSEHLKPIVKMLADAVEEKLWDDVRDWLLVDTETNVAGAVRNMVEKTVDALLTGKAWAMQRYPYADYSRGEEIRKAVAAHCGEHLLARRVADLEAELAKAHETIEWMRR